jgi:hypothetical protein
MPSRLHLQSESGEQRFLDSLHCFVTEARSAFLSCTKTNKEIRVSTAETVYNSRGRSSRAAALLDKDVEVKPLVDVVACACFSASRDISQTLSERRHRSRQTDPIGRH